MDEEIQQLLRKIANHTPVNKFDREAGEIYESYIFGQGSLDMEAIIKEDRNKATGGQYSLWLKEQKGKE